MFVLIFLHDMGFWGRNGTKSLFCCTELSPLDVSGFYDHGLETNVLLAFTPFINTLGFVL